MFDTNSDLIESFLKGRKAAFAIRGPRCDPPIPIFITVVIGLPVAPTHFPDRTNREKLLARSSSSLTTPLTPSSEPSENRRAVWRAGRFSEAFTISPANNPWILSESFSSFPKATSLSIVSLVTNCFEKSTCKLPTSKDKSSMREGSPFNNSSRLATSSNELCSDSSFHCWVSVGSITLLWLHVISPRCFF